MSENKILKLLVIKTPKKIYISEYIKPRSYRHNDLMNYYFDGQNPVLSFNKNWLIVDKIPTIIERDKLQEKINIRYELVDSSMHNDKIPLVLKTEEVEETDDDGYIQWKDKYSQLKSLYVKKWDLSEKIKESFDFDINIVLELEEDIIKSNNFSYKVIDKHSWQDINEKKITDKNIEHQLLDKIIFPEILLHKKSSKIKSKDLYGIIRAYVKEHIDLRYAKITSDYDFCFTVQKVLSLAEPYNYISKPFDKRKKSKKKFVTNRMVKVFEMTHKERNYQGYTAIEDIVGKDQDDLKNKIDELLASIIYKINEPLVECKHCGGAGAVLESNKDKT